MVSSTRSLGTAYRRSYYRGKTPTKRMIYKYIKQRSKVSLFFYLARLKEGREKTQQKVFCFCFLMLASLYLVVATPSPRADPPRREAVGRRSP